MNPNVKPQLINLKSAVLSQLSKGKQNAIKGDQLAERLGYYTVSDDGKKTYQTRSIRLAIEELIEEENEICSTPHPPYGYYLAATPEEVSEALRILKYGYGRKLYRHYRALLKAGQKAFPQQVNIPHGQLRLDLKI